MQNQRIQAQQEFREVFAFCPTSCQSLAKGFGLSHANGKDTISNYERGKVVPNILTLFQISKVMGIDMGYFFPDERFNLFLDDDGVSSKL